MSNRTHPQDDYKYAQQRQRQNEGGECAHCLSKSGHYITCPLINRAMAEEGSRQIPTVQKIRAILRKADIFLTEEDHALLKDLKISWDGDHRGTDTSSTETGRTL